LRSELKLPAPPDPATLEPLTARWKKNQLFFRVHSSAYGATEFNPGRGKGRFHPFSDVDGNAIPTLYGANSIDGALSETVFHDVAIDPRRMRRIFRERLKTLLLSALVPTRRLTLIDLRGYSLNALGLHRSQLLDSGAAAYHQTVRWARALHQAALTADGLLWRSRQYDTADALLLFGDRVERQDLKVAEAPRPLYSGAGFRLIKEAAKLARIAIIE